MNIELLAQKINHHLPVWPASRIFVSFFNHSTWQLLRELDWQPVYGKCFCVFVNDIHLRLFFSVTPRGLRAEHATHADVTFSASSHDFLRLALRVEDPDTLFFNRKLIIEGDTNAGLHVKNMLDGVELETILQQLPWPARKIVTRLKNNHARYTCKRPAKPTWS